MILSSLAAAALFFAPPPPWWLAMGGDADDWSEVVEVAALIGMEPRAMFTPDFEMTDEAARRLDALPPDALDGLGESDTALERAVADRATYLSNVAAMGQPPNPDILAIYDGAIRMAGGSSVSDPMIGGQDEASGSEGLDADVLADFDRAMRENAGAGAAGSDGMSAIAAAMPAERRPQAVFMTGGLGFGPYGTSTYDVSVGYLFPSGYLVDEECAGYDPMRAAPTPQGVAQAGFADCELSRARAAGPTYELWDEDEGWWTPDGTTPIVDAQARPGQRFDLTLVNEDGFSDPTGNFYSASGMSRGRLRLTSDGRIETNLTARMDAPSAMIAGPAITLGTKTTITTDTPVSGRYHLDGHVMTIALDGGGVVQKLFTLTRDADTNEIDGAFFGGAFYWLPD